MNQSKYAVVFTAWLFMALLIIFLFTGCAHNRCVHNQTRITPQFLGETIIHSYEQGKESGAEQMLELFKDLADQTEEIQNEKEWH